MQYTSNYNLITVEGTDVVNPLVQMNPNFTDIDAAMFANKQAVIGTASEVTVGTVHSITRANTDSDYFRFTATSNWNAGDSVNVDGVSVSIYLTDGTSPGTGAYVINSEVLCLLNGSRLTLIASASNAAELSAKAAKIDITNIIESGATASQAIANLTYFYLNGSLVKAISDIASGASFVLNTNYVSVSAGLLNDNTDWIMYDPSLYYRRVGNMVFIRGSISSNNYTWTTAGTLPIDLTPATEIRRTVVANFDTSRSAMIRINTDGTVDYSSNINVNFQESYILG